MSIEERLNKLEINYNILSNDINKMNTTINNINNQISKIDKFDNKLDQIMDIFQKDKDKKKDRIKSNSLAKEGNPFYDAAIENEVNESDNEDSDDEKSNQMIISHSDNSNNNKKRGKYKARNPLYYYYNIGGNIYKYTCKVKNRKNILNFKCSDTNCKAAGYYYKKDDKFKPNVFLAHIEYEDHSYIISEYYKNKFKDNKFTEEDFNKNNNKKILGIYFKCLFYEDENLFPLKAKEIFHQKFPRVNISTKDLDNYINVKYREIKKLHSEKIINTETLFKFLDKCNNNISKTIEYADESNPDKKYKLIIIANSVMLNNLKDNFIEQYFMDCTYKIVPPNCHNFKLMVLSGYNIGEKKNKIMFICIIIK